MTQQIKAITILMADDDPDDCLLAQEALEESQLIHDLYFVSNGEELLDYLFHRGPYQIAKPSPRPNLILLDLNMPKKDGREALKEIKANPTLRQIPVIILTTSKTEEDIYRTYDLGASSFITKPVTFDELVKVMESLGSYWFKTVKLPPQDKVI